MVVKEPAAELEPNFSSSDAIMTPWMEASERLERAEVYWLSMVRPEGRPHVTPVRAIWPDGALCFCTERLTKCSRLTYLSLDVSSLRWSPQPAIPTKLSLA